MASRALRGGALSAALALALAAATTPRVAADEIRKKDGRVIRGEIIGREQAGTPGEILKIAVGSATIQVPASEVASIRPATPAEQALRGVSDAMRAGRSADAISALARALDQGIAPDALAEPLRAHGDALLAAIPALPPGHRAALGRVLAAIESATLPVADDFAVTRLQMHLALEEPDAARRVFDELGPDYFARNEAARARLAEWLQRRLQAQQADHAFQASLATLEYLDRLDPEANSGARTQHFLQWAWRERQAGRFEEALQIYLKYIYDDVPDIARDRLLLTLGEAERTARERDDLPHAADLWARYGLAQEPKESRARLTQIWRDLAWQRIRRSDFAGAREALDRAEEFTAGAAARDRLLCDYHEQLAALAPDDARGRFTLALWAAERDLLTEAYDQLEEAQRRGYPAAEVQPRLAEIGQKLGERDLLALMDLYEAGEFGKVLAGVTRFMSQHYAPPLLKQAKEIEELTMEAVRIRSAERPQQAEAMWQQAQRAYNQERYAEANELLRTLIDRFEGTPAQMRARTFYATVRDKLALAELEAGRMPAADGRMADGRMADGRMADGRVIAPPASQPAPGQPAQAAAAAGDAATSATMPLAGEAPVIALDGPTSGSATRAAAPEEPASAPSGQGSATSEIDRLIRKLGRMNYP